MWVGLAFVLAAGFAREYDGEDLLREPWHLALPLVASLVTSFVLYLLLRTVGCPPEGAGKRSPVHYFDGYPALLRLYWWTAPLALLYAIPVEHMMGPADAARTNLMLLGLVASWRVLLITRAVSATWNVSFGAVLFPVMLFADAVALLMMALVPLPVVSFMGGIRLTETESIISSTTSTVKTLGILTFPLWAIGTAVVSRSLGRSGLAHRHGLPAQPASARISRPLAVFSGLALAVWLVVLPITQPAQQRRRDVEAALESGQFSEAVRLVRDRDIHDFPPHWDPPPRPGYGERNPDPLAVLHVARDEGAPAWFIRAYEAKVRQAER